MGMGKFNSDDHYIYYCGQDSLRRNGVVLIISKSLKCSTWVQSLKQQNDLSFQFVYEYESWTIKKVEC